MSGLSIAVNESSLGLRRESIDIEEGTRSEFLLCLVPIRNRLSDPHTNLEEASFDLSLIGSLFTELEQ